MCAIVGMIATHHAEQRTAMLRDKMKRRGPDGFGAYYEKISPNHREVALGHRRLATRDLTPAGAQPMHDPGGRYVLTYNGEIYNTEEIKSKLAAKGITQFKGTSDTEVLLHAWTQWRDHTPEILQGEFAFAVWDRIEKTLTLVRDRLGIIPLYYAFTEGEFAFASEVTPLYECGFAGPGYSPSAVQSYLTFGSVLEPETIFTGAFMLPAGTLMKVDALTLEQTTKRYWKNPFQTIGHLTPPCLEEIGSLLRDAIECRLVSDVPLTVFLSGGIDSSSIAATAHRGRTRGVDTLCVSQTIAPSPDRQAARLVASALGTRHQDIEVSNSEFETTALEAFAAMDQPTADGINTFTVAKATHAHGYTVALSGVGADELFAGYPLARRAKYFRYLRLAPAFLAATRLSRNRADSRSSVLLRAFLKGPRDISSYYAISRSYFLDPLRCELLPNYPTVSASDLIRKTVPWIDSVRDPINAVCALDVEIYLKNTLLRDTNALSLAHSLEVRAPFLDHRLVELVATIPGRYKLPRQTNKPLLVNTIGKGLPHEAVHRPKSGFVFPWKELIRGPLNRRIQRAFSSDYQSSWDALGISRPAAQRVFEAFCRQEPGVLWAHVWSLFSLVEWAQSRRAR